MPAWLYDSFPLLCKCGIYSVFDVTGVKQNLFYNFLLSISQILVPLISIPYVSRILDPEGIGRVGFVDGFTYYFVVLAEAGIMVYGIREVARCRQDKQALDQLVSELISLHIRTSLISLLLYAVAVWFLWSKVGDIRLLYFSVAFLLVNAFACEWYFIGQERFRYIALRSILIRLAGLMALLWLLKAEEDYYIYYAIIAGSAMVTGIWNTALLFREHPFRWRERGWRKHIPKVGVTYLISLLYSVPLYLDHVILRLFSTATMVGFYSFSVRLLRVSSSVISDSFLVFFPRVASLQAANEGQGVQERLSQNLQFILLLAVPMSAGAFLLADEFTAVFLGPSFAPAADNIRILSLYPLLRSYSLFLSNPVLMAHGYERAFLTNLLFATAVYLLAAILGSKLAAGTGICWALIIADSLLILANFRTVRRLMPSVRIWDFATLFRAMLAAIGFIPILWGIRTATTVPLFILLLGVPACALLYLGIMYWWMPAGRLRSRWHELIQWRRTES